MVCAIISSSDSRLLAFGFRLLAFGLNQLAFGSTGCPGSIFDSLRAYNTNSRHVRP